MTASCVGAFPVANQNITFSESAGERGFVELFLISWAMRTIDCSIATATFSCRKIFRVLGFFLINVDFLNDFLCGFVY